MRYFFAGLGALLLMSSHSLMAQPSLFSTNTKVSATARAARQGERFRRVDADAGVLRNAEVVDFNLFEDRRFLVRRTRSSAGNGTGVWTGEIAGTRGSEVIIVVEDGRLTGSIRTADGETYRLRPESDGSHSIEQVDASAINIDDEALEPPAAMLAEPKADETHRAAASMAAAALATAQSTVDVLVVYTAEARAAAGSTANIVGRIQLAIAEANQGFVNSGIDMQLRLVGTSETAPSSGQAANSTYLSTATYDAGIGALRNQYGADMVSVWINGPGAGGGVVGIGWIMSRPTATFQPYSFSVVELNFTNAPYYSFGHELGHNLGGAHDRTNAGGSSGAYPYAFGFQQQAGGFVDIMAYTNGCSGCRRINYFSNPDVSYAGYPVGVISTDANSADLRLTFNSTRTFAEQFRSAVTPPGGGAPPPAPVPAPTSYAPTVSTLSPTAGTGTSTVYTASFSDGNGASDIRTLSLSVQSASTANACYVTVDRASGAVQLRNDADNAWLTGLTLGQGATLANSQCTISGSGASLTPNGNTLSLVLPVSFTSAFAGSRDVMLRADDSGGLTSNWQKLGGWTVPSPSVIPPTPPSFLSLSPANGSGSGATFTALFGDPNGAFEISRAIVLINKALSSSGGCYIYLLAASKQYYLLAANGASWLGPAALGSGSLTNGNCSIGTASSLTVNGTSLAVTLPIQFGAAFTGAKNVYTNVADQTGSWRAWTTGGTFTVQ